MPGERAVRSAGRVRGRRVLVVEDDDAIRILVTAALAYELGVHAVGARDGQEGWAMVVEEPPALVVTDLRMPRLDGYGLISRLRSARATRAMPVVVMSALGERAEAVAAGCDDFVSKPFDLDDLLRAVRRLLEAER